MNGFLPKLRPVLEKVGPWKRAVSQRGHAVNFKWLAPSGQVRA